MRVGLTGVSVDGVTFARQVSADGASQCRVCNPMCRPGQRGFESACQLVLALCTRLKACQTLLDAIVHALVVAGLKMQAVIVRVRTPVAAEEGIKRTKKD